MMDPRRILVTLLTAVVLLPSGLAVALAQDEAEPVTPRAVGEPFAAILSGSVSFLPLEAPTEACQGPVMTITDAVGSSTLGDLSLHAEHCPTAGLPTVPLGYQSLATAEGDRLDTVYYADCLPVMAAAVSGEPITCQGRLEFAGGTGRFADADGTATETAFVWFPGSLEIQGWPWIAKLEGSIDY